MNKTIKTIGKNIGCSLMVALTMMSLSPDTSLAQRRGGGSFGGSRGGGFGGSRSSSRSYSAPSRSFGGSRSSSAPRSNGSSRSYSSPGSRSSYNQSSTSRNSFGGTTLRSGNDYRSRYGVPRSQSRETYRSGSGSTNYVVHRYGGMGDGFMTGYLLGSIPWYYHMPFHPAYYYSAPMTYRNPDGTVAVYPGTFEWGSLFVTLIIGFAIIFIVYVWLRNRARKRRAWSGSDMSESSFG